ncbi:MULTISPECIES: discoidin domain-containing protein [unclassified Amycolatopsis]|uniref:discoidin domain-containing protein n=1 Tax=unclassified Amycolatopsis TaxID=2618356 RepID=UPI002875F267|nr:MULTISPECIES: discoidin domain-containing protein [unclassified Amycolatopsis]MDS0135533.1 discoidin domain-containing protein [Amycolatopsis sp. 505]MDS0140776.1 discoidin domain-containing protein [Amycolatopsis sp. CM201R]
MSPSSVFSAPKFRFGALALAVVTAAGVTIAAVPAGALAAARGASVPFLEQEAETAATNGSVIGPNRAAGTLAGEASGRKAVTLSGQGQYVEFTLTAPANSIDVRYSVPDSVNGTVSLYVGGSHNRDIALTSKWAWYYGSYPFTNNPGDGHAHHFYDETRALLGTSYPAGTKIRLQVDAGDVTPVTVDLADFEQVGAAAARPANSVSVTDYGATANDAGDDAGAFDAAVAAARSQGKEVWIPAGTFTLGHHITVDQVTIRGAGPWYSVLTGPRAGIFGKGEPASCGTPTYPGNPAVPGTSRAVKLFDFAIIGQVDARVDCDQSNAIGGALGGGSVVQNLWLQHTKVGLWLDGPFDGLTVSGNRILDQTADGLNLHQGISNTLVTNNFLRNTGDDGLAMWSEHDADHHNTFSFNTVLLPILANNIAVYGGHDNTVSDNVVADNQDQGGGLHIANRFSAVPLSGTTTVARNTAIRTGVLDSNWQFGVGALWFDGRDSAITGRIDVTDNDLLDNNYEAIQFIDGATTDVHFDGVRIAGAGTFAWQLQAKPTGSVKNVVATGVGRAGVYNCLGPDAMSGLADQGGNSGWTTTYCGSWPTPVYGSDNGGTTTTPPPTTTPTQPSGNLALHKAISASGSQGGFPPGNAVDGDANSYWESTNNSFPQSLTVDFGSTVTVSRLVLKLPPSSAWGTRTQTISVDGVKAAAGYTFNPASGNSATVTFPATSVRTLRLTFTGNTGWPAGQLSELEAYSS